MNRTRKYKILYIFAIALLMGFLIFCIFYFRLSMPAIFLLAIVFFIPGRMQGYFWRDFYRGRKLVGRGEWENSLRCFGRFLADLKKRPWLIRLNWLNWGMYTRDIEAMTYNNMGLAHLGLGRLSEAEQHFIRAIEIDSEYPLPYYNRALLEQIKGDTEEAASLLKKSQTLGYSRTTYDKLIQTASSILAHIEGHRTR